jgi:hypothetical protein
MWIKPEAARIVLPSGLPIELVGWHQCRGEAVLNANDIDRILRLGTTLARFAIDCNRTAKGAYFKQTGETGISLPDPVAMAVALDPTICVDASAHYVDAEVTSDLTRGRTVVDRLGIAGNRRNSGVWSEVLQRGNLARICWAINIGHWKAALFRAMESQRMLIGHLTVHYFLAAFFRFAHAFFIVSDIFLLKVALLAVAVSFFGGNRAFAVTAVGVAAIAAVAFFRFAQGAFIAADIFLLNSASSGGAMMAASLSEIFGATGSALAALIAAQRLFCPSAILRRVAALNPFFLGAGATLALGLTQSGMVGSS